MRVSWKLLPLAAVFALGIAVLMPGGGLAPHTANADVDDFDFDAAEFVSGGDVGGLVTLDPAAEGDVSISVSDPGDASGISLTLVGCEPFNCSDDAGASGVIEVSDNVDEIEFTLTASCDEETDIEVTVSEEGAEGEVSDTVTCQPVTENLTITKVADDDDDLDFDFEVSGGGSECEDDFPLADGESASFECDNDEEITITEEVPSGWTVSIDCSGATALDVDEANGTVTFEIDQGDEVECTFENELSGTVTPGAADSVSLSVSSTNPACNLPVVVVATVRDDDGAGIGGAEVEFSAPSGSFTITDGTTSASGVVSTLYSPPNTGSESIVLTATANGETGTATITTNCEAQATATPVPPTVVPTQEGSIQPPSTGSAGLSSGTSAWLYVGAAFAVAFAFTGAIVVRRRS